MKENPLKASKSEIIISSSVLSKDLMMDIFSRLPTKSLGKLRCVSKDWGSTISTPFFKSLHRHRSSLKPHLLFIHDTNNSIDSNTNPSTITMSSVDFNGNHFFDFTFTLDEFACFLPSKCTTGELICFVSEHGFYVCNPSTQELVKLAKPSFPDTDALCAFGYIKENNEYVLVNAHSAINGKIVCEVMRWTDDGTCLNDRAWKKHRAKCPYSLYHWGVLVGTSFYWIGFDENEYDVAKIVVVVSFNWRKEDFGTVMLPGSFDPDDCCLLELKGMLCLTDVHEDEMDIWMLKDAENSMWVKEYTIDLSMINYEIECVIPVDHMDGKIQICLPRAYGPPYHVWYDVDNKYFSRIDNPKSGQWRWCKPYIDGLFSLGS